jgi:hypothetical protein
MNKFTWFNRPGQASTFKTNDGTVQLCNTSAALTKSRRCVLVGKITLLLVSNSRKYPCLVLGNQSKTII